MSKKIIVIGSGIAGLSAAYDLSKQGNDVTVFESSLTPGGRMADLTVKGLNIHSGATIIWDNFKDMMDLCDELGMKDQLVSWTRDATRVDNGEKTYDIQYHFSLTNMLAHPAFGTATKLKLAKLLPDIIRSGLKTDPCFMHTAAEFDTESVADYLTNKGVVDFLENYIEPLFRAPWNWEPEQFSKAYLLTMMGHLPTAKTHTFKHGIGSLTRELSKHVDVKYNTKVLDVLEDRGTGCKVTIEDADGTRTLDTDLVVFAAPADRARELVSVLDTAEKEFFESVKYNECGVVYYVLNKSVEQKLQWYTRKHPSPVVFYAQIPEDEHVPEGHNQPSHLYLELTPQQRDKAIAEGNTGNLKQYVHQFAKDMYPTVEEDTVEVIEQWIPQMLPLWYPGYAKKVASFIQSYESTPRNVYFAGDYLAHSHTGGACASGRRAARLISKHWM